MPIWPERPVTSPPAHPDASMSLVKGLARPVPDFAKLHALEEQRVARWKRQHKKELTGACPFFLPLVSIRCSLSVLSLRRAGGAGAGVQTLACTLNMRVCMQFVLCLIG